MTGFGRLEGLTEGQSWVLELRSVNGRGLDVRVRVPAGLESVEAALRAQAGQRFTRGSITANLSITRTSQSGTALRLQINRPLLAEVMALARELEGAGAAPPRLDALLGVRGVIEAVGEAEDDGEQRQRLAAAIEGAIAEAVDRLAASRAEEGARLAALVAGQLEAILALAEAARGRAQAQVPALRERMRAQIDSLLGGATTLPEERLAQEVAILATRTDVTEELDRLIAHAGQMTLLVTSGGAVGRRLDFLCQELNREANTLCSKSSDLELTRLGLELKAVIDQLREQVQNLE